MKGELEEAERLLHEASWLSQQSSNNAAIIYTYDMMANLAFLRGELAKAEKLFKVTMSYMLAGDVKQDDNAILQMSLKLASIYAAQNQDKLALAGYQFCILTLEEKVAKQKEMPAGTLPEEERVNTHLLLAMSMDSYARYLLAHNQTALAQTMYERALKIAMEVNGERHPQTVVVMNDLATALDTQGLYDEAYAQVSRAAELAQQTQHTDTHVILNNLAGILIHKGDYSQARQVYQTALEVAEKSGDGVAVRYITKELAQLAKRKRVRSRGKTGLQETSAGKDGAEGQEE
ncbi:PREDICTED: tetratricopeptide repeat protein 19, mitochondrial [Thamnophis sirtalis]|uniref:Tetratricopeptide repeat protein 19, mitochondrial n=1 Tax=Thamnophis sirtalis TaxID=35019 RepID=A0A6I9YUQ8_9SAUR|nr:PREDICTED: tetratricopeptide repeat protein 19, mitochondrial [Thamnophis sirtalis]